MTSPTTTSNQVARALAAHRVLPPTAELPPDANMLCSLLADMARGERSDHAELLREVGVEFGTSVDDLAQRARFALACLLLPAAGTHYEILGVSPDADDREIRRHWAAAIRRYHPDHFAGRTGWLDVQARRLIMAYQTLRDPERRRRYDAELARQRLHAAGSAALGPAPAPRARRPLGGHRSLAVVLVGLALAAWAWLGLSTARTRLGAVAIPPAPRILDRWRAAVPPTPVVEHAARPDPCGPAVGKVSAKPIPQPVGGVRTAAGRAGWINGLEADAPQTVPDSRAPSAAEGRPLSASPGMVEPPPPGAAAEPSPAAPDAVEDRER